jgi:uncharacterized membrane-anchored protein
VEGMSMPTQLHSSTKVPKIAVYFWITKILTTAMGEATSDFLAHRFGPVRAVVLGASGLLLALVLQFWVRRYISWVYWLAVAMVAVFGTMAADGLHVEIGIPYIISALFFAIVLTIVFIEWSRYEGTLSIHSIYTPRREGFYWATVLSTFALGTAVGDLTATTLHLGYLTSGIIFAGVFAIPAIAYWKFRLNAIGAFWFAYVITRPLGASFADWMDISKHRGGLGLGTGAVSIGLSIIIICLVAFLAFSHKDT